MLLWATPHPQVLSELACAGHGHLVLVADDLNSVVSSTLLGSLDNTDCMLFDRSVIETRALAGGSFIGNDGCSTRGGPLW